jgi:hypothetical protein
MRVTRQQPGRSVFGGWANFWRSLVAVLTGNAIYFAIQRYLPPRAQHHLYRVDWGLAVDFWLCLACYGLLRLIR